MTSNIGSDLAAAGLRGDALERARKVVLTRHFRPEFINRLDGLVQFHALGREHMLEILDIQLDRVRERLSERDLSLEVSDEARVLLSERGFDAELGARPLRRLIERTVLEPLSRAILAGTVCSGDTVDVELDGDQIAVRRRPT